MSEGIGQASRSDEPQQDERRAMDAALAFLSYRPRTRQEVRRKLRERGFDDATVERILGRLTDVGLVDDAAFVEAYVRERIAHRPTGARRLTEELYVKGVGADFAKPIIESVFAAEGVDERALAARALQGRLRRLPGGAPAHPAARRRLAGYLARRGFDHTIVREILRDLESGSRS